MDPASEIFPSGLGDCWLMAALACLAEYPTKLKSLFETKQITEVWGGCGRKGRCGEVRLEMYIGEL